MKLTSNPKVKEVFNNYPSSVQDQLLNLRKLTLIAASEINELDDFEETLKWGKPSYLTKYGSTVRMDWKKKSPDQYAIYFKCMSLLVPTFKARYKDIFKFEANRAIVFKLNEQISFSELKHCITLAFTYHKKKHIDLFGV
jgi:hypothetical protein